MWLMWLIGSLSYSIHIICLVSLKLRFTCSKFLLLLLVIIFGLSGIKLIMKVLSRMLLLYISSTINKTVLEHHAAWKSTLAISREVWQSPSPHFFKINYDTAIRYIFSAQVVVCRDSRGFIIKCVSLISSPCSPIMVKLLQLSWQLDWRFLWVYSTLFWKVICLWLLKFSNCTPLHKIE
jgi:hypothetical protein